MGGTVTVEALRDALELSWAADTSRSRVWSASNRAKGQCAVTACVVQDYLGGEIYHSVATLPGGETFSHYFNVIDGRSVDLTKQQFPSGTTFTEPAPKTKGYPSTREYCLSYEDMVRRYRTLAERTARYLGTGR
ncbi:YunG family protein [Nocardia sp. CDC160]|uniref:YunG family protein n=1 Tax=Nocardia sp. CDC160 TaxID=3112166 RepID=UPI002DBDC884|nr:hypothetical protein [Nocardia sp. CDC160]MEC3917703.1 hypothetical protein [Nocardia sp. CDC160]